MTFRIFSRLAASRLRPILWAALLSIAGSHANAIVGPSAEAPGLAPFIVMVLQRQGRTAGFCSGVVLAPRIVITAAHCAPPGAELRIHFRDAGERPVLLPVAETVRHPGYKADAIRSRRRSIDLALLRLPQDLPARFRAAALGTVDGTVVGAAFRIAGFGVARENDGASGGVLRVATLRVRAPLSSLLIWATDARHSAACTGDSGGPILDEASDTVEAITLWSAGDGGKTCGALTQALWLGPHRAWINDVIRGWDSQR